MPEPDVQMISGQYYVIDERRVESVESEGQPITYYFGKYDTKSGNNYKFDDLIQYNDSLNNYVQINLEEPKEFSSDTHRFILTVPVDGKKKSHKKKSHKKKSRKIKKSHKKKIKKSLRKY
jgi:hypothetical protein